MLDDGSARRCLIAKVSKKGRMDWRASIAGLVDLQRAPEGHGRRRQVFKQ
jgi:hypothetical protein